MEQSDEDERYSAELKMMFATVGWKFFVTELTENYKALDSLNGVDSIETLQYRKGQMVALANIINLEAILEANAKLEDSGEVEEEVIH